MNKTDIKNILEEHLTVLENAAKKQCSGEEFKAITEAMYTTIHLIGNFGNEYHCSEGKCRINPLSKRPLEGEAQNRKPKTIVEIFVKERGACHGKNRFVWAWRESAEKNVFGGASSLAEVKAKAERMFPGSKIVLLLL